LELRAAEASTGRPTVNAGKLFVDGLGQVGAVSLAGGTLGGTGKVGTVTAAAAGGMLVPGTLASGAPSPGVLAATGNTVLNANSTYQVLIDGTTAGNGDGHYSQLNVTGTVNLGNAVLSVVPLNNIQPPIGTSFIIMTATGGFTGALAGQASSFITGGMKFNVTVNTAASPQQLILQRIQGGVRTAITQGTPPS